MLQRLVRTRDAKTWNEEAVGSTFTLGIRKYHVGRVGQQEQRCCHLVSVLGRAIG